MNFFRGLGIGLAASALLWAASIGIVLWLRVDLLTPVVVLVCGGALIFHALVRITEP